MRQIEVINQETIIDVTAETSNVEILVRDYDSELVERFALEAQEAAIEAEESADIATAQASIATAQATIATTQAGIATTQAGNALTSANNAAASAQEAQDIVDSIITADLTEATSAVLTITGGTDAVLGTGTTIQVKQAGSSQSGFLSSTDWTTFNSKQNTITNPVTGTGASGQVAFWNGTSSQTGDNGLFWNNTNKRLGIGTNAPLSILDVSETASTAFQRLRTTSTSASSDVGLKIQDGTTGFTNNDGLYLGRASAINYLWTYENEPLVFGTNNIERIRLNANGNFGIGTNSPIAQLDVATSTSPIISTCIRTTSTSASTSVGLRIQDGTTGIGTADGLYLGRASAINYLWTYETEPLVFGTSNSERMRLFANGNIGINTTTDAGFRLDVIGTARMGTLRLLNLTDTLEFTNTLVRIRRVANRMAFDGFDGFEFVDSNASASRMRIFGTSGNVLIQNGGTFTDAGFRLDVNGTARFSDKIQFGRVNFSTNDADGQFRIVANSIIYNSSGAASLSSSSAAFELVSTTKGFLPPRMTTTQRNAIASPATGLQVFDTTLNQISYYNGTSWINL
jgi:hypothetical protein